MSHNNFILNLLNLKDPNITFNDNYYSEEIINNVKSKVFYATLTYMPNTCYHCGHTMDKHIIKYGFKTSMIKLPKVSEFNTFLKLKKQRFYCKHCNSTFILHTPIVNKHCFISNNTKIAIALTAKEKISEKDIAFRYNVSHVTVNRIIDQAFYDYKPNFNYLPKNLCFDEFKSVKSATGAMSFIFCDADKGTILDIIENRKLYFLEKYFLRYSKKARYSVKRIIIDMYSPYITLIKKLFPKSKIVIDKFHIIQLFHRAFNKTRIKLMNSDDKNYYKYKKYWKLLLKDAFKVDYIKMSFHRSFKKNMREIDIINYLLDLNSELKASYNLYQSILYAIKTKKYQLLESILNNNHSDISDYMKTSIKSIKKYKDYIKNTFECDYTNGLIEGINNKIKVIKRIAFGYKSFFHFKNRILISQNLLKLKAV